MTGVVVNRDGRAGDLTADIVVVSAGAANTARLLFSSANDRHPNGLGQRLGPGGRNYMFHNSQAVLALSQGAQPDGVPEDARAQRLLPRARRLDPRWATSRWWASPGAEACTGRGAQLDDARADLDPG